MATISFSMTRFPSFVFLETTLLAIAAMRIPVFMGIPICKKFRAWFNFMTTRTLLMSISSITGTMRFGMFRSIGHNQKIGNHVVTRISIDMMNRFIWSKLPIEMLFHNVTMLKHTFTIYLNNVISIFSCGSPLISWMVRPTKCKVRTVTRAESLLSTGWFKFFIAAFTEMFHNILYGINGLKGYSFMPVKRRWIS